MNTNEKRMAIHPWRIDPARLPQRIDLEVSAAVHAHLRRLSARTGRSVRDLASELICREVGGSIPAAEACPPEGPPASIGSASDPSLP